MLNRDTELHARAIGFLNDFKSQTPLTFRRTVQLHRDITQGNQLLTASFTNSFLYRTEANGNSTEVGVEIWWRNSFDLTCNCGTSNSACSVSLASFCSFVASNLGLGCFPSRNISITGFMLACHPVDGYLLSSLECLQNRECLQQLLDMPAVYFNSTPIRPSNGDKIEPGILNANSTFKANTSILEIMNLLTVDKWTEEVKFAAYYEQCKPAMCLYTITERLNIFSTIVFVIGVAGGLSVVLRIASPTIVECARFLNRRRKRISKQSWTKQGNQVCRCCELLSQWTNSNRVICMYQLSSSWLIANTRRYSELSNILDRFESVCTKVIFVTSLWKVKKVGGYEDAMITVFSGHVISRTLMI
jgi:hypothetical protein